MSWHSPLDTRREQTHCEQTNSAKLGKRSQINKITYVILSCLANICIQSSTSKEIYHIMYVHVYTCSVVMCVHWYSQQANSYGQYLNYRVVKVHVCFHQLRQPYTCFHGNITHYIAESGSDVGYTFGFSLSFGAIQSAYWTLKPSISSCNTGCVYGKVYQWIW